MKKILFTLLAFTVFSMQTAYGFQCDQTFEGQLRHGKSYSFNDTINHTNYPNDIYVGGVKVNFDGDKDFNGSEDFPTFSATDWINDKSFIVKPGESGKIVTSDTNYNVRVAPDSRKQDNFVIQYDMTYYDKIGSGWSEAKHHTECKYYEVTWCGDGVLDSDYETCDPNDPTKKNWGPNGCNNYCEPNPEVDTTCHQTFKNKLRYGYKYTLSDKFKNLSSNDIFLSKFDIDHVMKQNLSDSAFPTFSWTSAIKANGNILAPQEELVAIRSNSTLNLNYHPTQRAYDNIFVKYKAIYFKKRDGKYDTSTPNYHNECQYYEVTWCGDGIVDDYVEEDGTVIKESCDPNDPDKAGWGDGGCDPITCEPVQKPATCEQLEVTPTTGVAPLSNNFSCTAVKADSYDIVVRDANNNIVKRFNSPTGSFTLDNPGNYTATCYVSDGEKDNITAAECEKDITVEVPKIPECTGITVTPDTGVAPVSSDIVCEGIHTNDFKIKVLKNGVSNPLYEVNNKTGNYTFSEAGTFKAICYAANKTAPVCQKTLEIEEPKVPSIEVDKREGDNVADLRPNYSTTTTPSYDIQTIENGENASFKITVKNDGNVALKDLVLVDKIDGKVSDYCGGTVDLVAKKVTGVNTYNFTYIGNVGNHANSTLEPNETFTYNCEVPKTVKSYTNNIKVTGIPVIPNLPPVEDDDDSEVVTKKPEIKVTKSDGNSNDLRPDYRGAQGFTEANDIQTVKPNDEAVFTIKVENTGTEALKDIVLTDKIDDQEIDYCEGKVNFSTNKVIPIKGTGNGYTITHSGEGDHDNDTLEPGEVLTYKCSVPKTEKNYTNVIYVEGTGVISGITDEDDDDSFVEIITPSIEVDKKDLIADFKDDYAEYEDIDGNLGNDKQTVELEEDAVFTITVKNNGTEPLKNITLTDKIGDNEIDYCGGEVKLITKKVIGENTYDFTYTENSAGIHTNNILEPNEEFIYTCSVPNTVENYTNKIIVSGTGYYTDIPVDEEDTTEVNVEKIYDLALIKKPKFSGAKNVGDTVTFQIEVHNQGNIDAKDIEVTDYIPTDYLEFIEDNEKLNQGWVKNGNKATYEITDTIPAVDGTTVSKKSLEISFKIIDFPSSGTITNWAEISKDNGDDCDSTPDSDQSNDKFETDDYLGEQCDKNDKDEDDHDPAYIEEDSGSSPANFCEELEVKETSTKNEYEMTCTGDLPNIVIDCGNGTSITPDGEVDFENGEYSLTGICKYEYNEEDEDIIGGNNNNDYTAVCRVGGTTESSCQQPIEIDEPGGGTPPGGGNPPGGGTPPDGGNPPSDKTWCGDGEVQRPSKNNPDGNGNDLVMEECDFGSGTWPAWCDKNTCEIDMFTLPGETILEFGPAKHQVIGLNSYVFKTYNDEVYVKFKPEHSNLTDIYLGKLCITKDPVPSKVKDIIGSEYCKTINGNGILKKGQTFRMTVADNIFKTASTIPSGMSYRDNNLKVTFKKGGTLYGNTYLSNNYKLRVAKPSIVTTGGGTGYVQDEDKDISNVSDVSITNKDKNKNFSSVSVSDNLSGTTTEVDDDKSKDTSDKYNENTTNDTSTATNKGKKVNLGSHFKLYRGISGAYGIKDYDIELNSIASDAKSKTYIIENGDLYINTNVNYTGNIAFVVKGGNIIIGDNVTKLKGTYITIPANGHGGKIMGDNVVSDKQLHINGSLYGDIKDITNKRTYLKQEGDQLNVGTIVSFGSSVFRKPAPLTSSFINEYFEATRVAK